MGKKEQVLILVDDNDNVLGYAPRSECHKGAGKRHRAFVIALYNRGGKILLQERRHPLWDHFWDLTAASHPLHSSGKDETYESAAGRCLDIEWNIKGAILKNIGAFNYFEKHNEDCENEHCALLVGEYNGAARPGPKSAYGYRWISLKDLKSEAAKNPKKFTPWLIPSIPILEKEKGLK